MQSCVKPTIKRWTPCDGITESARERIKLDAKATDRLAAVTMFLDEWSKTLEGHKDRNNQFYSFTWVFLIGFFVNLFRDWPIIRVVGA